MQRKINLPKISIVTPSYNQAQFLEQTINSVLNQGYPNLEYIIIDGGSTDCSVDIIKKYEDKLHYWCSEPDKGMYDALNKGFAKSTGEIMAWINADDIYMPYTFRTISSLMGSLNEVKWISSLKPLSMDINGIYLSQFDIHGFSKQAFYEGYYLYDGKYAKAWIPQESTFWRRDLWIKSQEKIALEYKYAGDYWLWAKFYEYENLIAVDIPLACFRYYSGQKSSFQDFYRIESYNISRKYCSNHFLSYIRKIILNSKMYRWNIINRLIKCILGFRGIRIKRHQSHLSTDIWTINKYRFI